MPIRGRPIVPPKRYLAITEINVGDKTDFPLPSPQPDVPREGLNLELVFLQAGRGAPRRRMERALALILSVASASLADADGHYAARSRSVYSRSAWHISPAAAAAAAAGDESSPTVQLSRMIEGFRANEMRGLFRVDIP